MMTAEEFLAYPLPDAKGELVRGELRVTPPAGGPHGVAVANLVFMVSTHVRAESAGYSVTGLGTSFFGFRELFASPTLRSCAPIDSLPTASGPGS
jgi:Uma2 family endonuclease